jgi:hypothetical protein
MVTPDTDEPSNGIGTAYHDLTKMGSDSGASSGGEACRERHRPLSTGNHEIVIHGTRFASPFGPTLR